MGVRINEDRIATPGAICLQVRSRGDLRQFAPELESRGLNMSSFRIAPLRWNRVSDVRVAPERKTMSRSAILESVVQESKKTDLPKIWPGDTVKVHVKVREGGK